MCHHAIRFSGFLVDDRFWNGRRHPLTRVANTRQLTPSQETVGQRVFGHVEIRTFSDLARLFSFAASVDVTDARYMPRSERSVV